MRSTTYDDFKARCDAQHLSMSGAMEEIIYQWLGRFKLASADQPAPVAAPVVERPKPKVLSMPLTADGIKHRAAIADARARKDQLKEEELKETRRIQRAKADSGRLRDIKAASDRMIERQYKGEKPAGVLPVTTKVKSFSI